MTRRARTAAATGYLALLVAVSVGSCGSGDDDDAVEPLDSQAPSATVTSTANAPSETPTDDPVSALGDLRYTEVVGDTTTGDEANDGALRTYIAFTEVSGRIFAEPTPEATGAELYSTGPALQGTVDVATRLADDGRSYHGAVIIRPTVSNSANRLVLIEDCMDQSAVRERSSDGGVTDVSGSDWIDVDAEVQLVTGEGWRVSSYQTDGRSGPCDG